MNIKKHGFTLIELLVVIAIIAILAAILFPVFAKAREKAQQSSCASNLKQVALGVIQYKQDWDEIHPMYNYGGAAATDVYWVDLIYPYVKSVKVFRCPSVSDSTRGTNWPAGVPRVNFSATDFITYNFNPNVASIADAMITNPVNTFALWDANIDDGYDVWYWYYQRGGGPNWNRHSEGNGARLGYHSEGDNYAFVDGHVKWLKQATVPTTDSRFSL